MAAGAGLCSCRVLSPCPCGDNVLGKGGDPAGKGLEWEFYWGEGKHRLSLCSLHPPGSWSGAGRKPWSSCPTLCPFQHSLPAFLGFSRWEKQRIAMGAWHCPSPAGFAGGLRVENPAGRAAESRIPAREGRGDAGSWLPSLPPGI